MNGNEITASWSGPPVSCIWCLKQHRPVAAGLSYRLPIHGQCGTIPCPGSYAKVTAPAIHPNMERRIENHFVDAMPTPDHENEVAP